MQNNTYYIERLVRQGNGILDTIKTSNNYTLSRNNIISKHEVQNRIEAYREFESSLIWY